MFVRFYHDGEGLLVSMPFSLGMTEACHMLGGRYLHMCVFLCVNFFRQGKVCSVLLVGICKPTLGSLGGNACLTPSLRSCVLAHCWYFSDIETAWCKISGSCAAAVWPRGSL